MYYNTLGVQSVIFWLEGKLLLVNLPNHAGFGGSSPKMDAVGEILTTLPHCLTKAKTSPVCNQCLDNVALILKLQNCLRVGVPCFLLFGGRG